MMVIRRKMKNMHCKARTFRPHDRQNITFGLFCIIVVVVFWSTTWAKWSVRSATISSNRDIHLSYAAMGSPWDEGKARGHFVVPKIKKKPHHNSFVVHFIWSSECCGCVRWTATVNQHVTQVHIYIVYGGVCWATTVFYPCAQHGTHKFDMCARKEQSGCARLESDDGERSLLARFAPHRLVQSSTSITHENIFTFYRQRDVYRENVVCLERKHKTKQNEREWERQRGR